MKKEKEIGLGYIDLDGWIPGDKLYPTWMDEDNEEYAETSMNPEEDILPAGKYTLKITYPLSNPYIQMIDSEVPIKRKSLVELIAVAYRYIYIVEKQSSEVAPALIPGMLNRIQTNGTFGIWGHSLGDLMLHTVYVDEDNVITVECDS
jgi:hypothetical protein